MKATIFDIQRTSFVDGPGIRTTVFFKGCNLRCAWCHNPESQRFEKQIMFYKDKCIGCGKCFEKCHNQLKNCDFCGQCEIYCPSEARRICGSTIPFHPPSDTACCWCRSTDRAARRLHAGSDRRTWEA